MRIKLLLIAMLSGMAVHAPEEPESSLWPGWNIPASFPEGSIGNAMQTFSNSIYCFVKSLFPASMGEQIEKFNNKAAQIMAKVDPSLENNQLKMKATIAKLLLLDFNLFAGSYIDITVLPEEILSILDQEPEEIFNRIAVLETAIDQKPDLVRLLRNAIGLNWFKSYDTDQLIEHLKKNMDTYPELHINPEHFDSIYRQMCAQKYKYTIPFLLALDEEKPGRLGQLADDLERISKDSICYLSRQNWGYKLQDELMPLAKLILNWNKILYDLAPRPSISKSSVFNGLSANLSGDKPMSVPIDTDNGFKLFKLLYQGGFAHFNGDKVKIIGGHVPYYAKKSLLYNLSLLPNFPGLENLSELMIVDLIMDKTSFGLSEAGEIKIQQIIPNMFPSFRNDPQNQISIMMNGWNVGSFYITVAEAKGFQDTTRMTCRDLIDHLLRITAIEFHIDGFGDRLITLNNLNIPLDHKLYEARQTLHNAIIDRSYDLFESFRQELLRLPGLTKDNEQAINSIENPFFLEIND